jgi:NAD(P)H dehydrogenase (quinone)
LIIVPVRTADIYYSATGTVHRLAEAAARAAADAGAVVRLRRVAELAPREVIAARPEWAAHVDATAHIPAAELDDLRWADVVLFGTPTRYGNVAAQLKQFLDTTGPLWMAGELADKVIGAFTSASSAHGGHETTLLALYNTMHHWGSIIVPAGYAGAELLANGNPYGVSTLAAYGSTGPDESALAAVQAYARRVVRVGATIAAPAQAA